MAHWTFPALGEKIGQGGMGSVYNLAKGPDYLVLKTINLDPEALTEAVLTSQLLHPDIIRAKNIYFAGKPRNQVGLLLTRARPLEAKFFPLDWAEMRNILLQAVCGVEKLHSSGILHLDIKPANMLLLGPTGTDLIITDFGLSAPLHAASFTGERGTPGFYRQPFQASVQTDLEALVVSLWMIITTWITGSKKFIYHDGKDQLTYSVTVDTDWPEMAARLSELRGVRKAAAALVALSELLKSRKKLDADMIRKALLSKDKDDYTCPDVIMQRELRDVLDNYAQGSLKEDDFIRELAREYKDFGQVPGLSQLAQYVLSLSQDKELKQEALAAKADAKSIAKAEAEGIDDADATTKEESDWELADQGEMMTVSLRKLSNLSELMARAAQIVSQSPALP